MRQGNPHRRLSNAAGAGAKFITPIPKPKKRKAAAAQPGFVFDEGKGLSTEKQLYDPTPIINELRYQVDQWRKLSPQEKRRCRRQAIPGSVARTMAFEGEAISSETLQKILNQIGIHVSSTPHSGS